MGIGHGADEWRRRLGARPDEDWVLQRGERAGEKPFVFPAAERSLFWGAVRALLEAPPPPERGAGWRAFSEWALERHRRFLEPDPRVEGAVARLAELDGLALERPDETLLEALAELSEPLGGAAGVQVLDAMAARGLSFRALVVLGMNERVFPRFILEDAFLRDAVRSRIEHRLGPRIPRRLRGNDEERLLYELLLGSADEVVLSHQRSDEKGRLQSPSAFLPGGDLEQVPRRPADRLRSRPLELLTPREASIRTGAGEALGRAMGWEVGPLVRGIAFLEAIDARGAPGPYDGRIDARGYWNAVAAHGLSPSALERLAECPFRYFASRMLDLEELEEPEAEEMLSPIEIGQIYHGVLEQYYQYGDLESRLEEGFERFEGTRSIRYPVLWEVEKERIRRVLRALVDSDDLSFYSPSRFEEELRAEIPLEVGGRGTVAFRGFVDRMDLGPDNAFRVVDYKKSKGKYGLRMETGVFEKGRYLQPPLYFMLAQSALGEVDLARSRFSFYFLEEVLKGEAWEMALDGRAWAERRDEFEARLKALLETLARGDFVIRPGQACRTCEIRTACRKSHYPTRRRAEEFESLREREREEEFPA
jgi:ATP-dependent helicase/nuclease subunit B